ncbi:FlaR protein (FlaR) [Arsukibacterium sp. MJ3]|uniref:UDP-2,4-diacetamido-2,4, 6-trideoxy-beta-L-altropyranose hydrolase n=1 Tax=Arsukibacterium sp. MJ3 TaxID=1632859 RepID=UPI000626F220|nr:UDP-2,4-diacetamido-2,4,6-trideoxy-beta-L-altropyranose hydrolase [Arsukibacterium sp. MJ3]KKO48172.1 FlaR protein (FlaR) [Arsukibacterium sp. MJ3]
MNVLFRTDASVVLGSGHVMRCLTLAHALRKIGAQCDFACRLTSGHLADVIRDQGFTLLPLPENLPDQAIDACKTLEVITHDYSLLVVDHYLLAADYCQRMRLRCSHIMQIDDLANREYDCDLLLDQNLVANAEHRYSRLLPPHCMQMLGPRYALLREEFYQVVTPRNTQHILIGFGGSDEQNLTSLAIEAVNNLKLPGITADIVIGANNPWHVEIKKLTANLPNMRLHVQCNYMAKLMHQAQLMLGGGGASHWERCICALPGLVVTVAENQQATTTFLDQLGACVWLGQAADMTAEFFAEQLCYYLSQPALLDRMGQTAAGLIPAAAGTPLVVDTIMNTLNNTNG